MIPEEPVSQWLLGLPAGDSLAQHHVLQKYVGQLELVANRYLGNGQRDVDGEDVAIKVLNSLFQRVADGRLAAPSNRKELGRLLNGMAKNKSAELIRRKLAAKRGRGKVRGDSGFANLYPRSGIAGVAAQAVSPKQAFENSRVFRELLASMKDDQIRKIALMRMSEHSVEEIAKALCCSKSTIERRIRELKRALSRRSCKDDLRTRR